MQKTPFADELVCLRGNHEQMFVDASADMADIVLPNWMANGGTETLASYRVRHPADLPEDHRAWLAARPVSFESEGRLFVHAGIRPGIALHLQKDDDLLWIREPFLSSEEHHELLIVHGHTPTRSRKPDLRANRLNIDTGAGWDGPLTAAVFAAGRVGPLAFLTDAGTIEEPAGIKPA
jgi:serine/threonine protein phosphatase 1